MGKFNNENSISNATTKSLEGIFWRGYGVVPKKVLTDASLSPTARLIYAYYCCRSDNRGGWQESPARETMFSDLGLSRATFQRHRSTLIKRNLLVIEQNIGTNTENETVHCFGNGRFLLPKNVGENETPADNVLFVQEGVFSDGYGIVPRAILFDRNLSCAAKSLYALLCVYAPASTQNDLMADHPELSIARLSKSFFAHDKLHAVLGELQEKGYVKTVDRRPLPILYVLPLHPHRNSVQPSDSDTTEHPVFDATQPSDFDATEHPVFDATQPTVFDATEHPDSDAAQPSGFDATEIDATEIDATYNITGERITQERITSIRPSARAHVDGQTDRTGAGEQDDLSLSWVAYTEKQIEADILQQEFPPEAVQAIVNTIADVYALPDSAEIRIDGTSRTASVVKAAYRKLNFHSVEFCIEQLRESKQNNEPVRNPRAYIRSALYNALTDYGYSQLFPTDFSRQ